MQVGKCIVYPFLLLFLCYIYSVKPQSKKIIKHAFYRPLCAPFIKRITVRNLLQNFFLFLWIYLIHTKIHNTFASFLHL